MMFLSWQMDTITSSQSTARLLLLLSIVFYMFSVGSSSSCFECSSLNETYCPEVFSDDDDGIVPYNDCSYIHEGRYCVKAVGIIGETAGDIYCFVCDETESQDFGCSSPLFSAPLVSCRDTFDAQYCIKATGLYAGSLGTRRFCASRDLGNYCEYIRRPGDQREYRSCVYTCTGDGCNGAGKLSTTGLIVAGSVLSLVALFRDASCHNFVFNS